MSEDDFLNISTLSEDDDDDDDDDDDFNIDSGESPCLSRMDRITDDNEASALPDQCQLVRPPTMPRRLKSFTFKSAAALGGSSIAPRRTGSVMKNSMDSPSMVAPQQLESSSTSICSTTTTTTSTAISAPPRGTQRMESSSTSSCATSTSILAPPSAATKFEPLIIPHRLQSKDCLPIGVSPPPKPQRLQSVEDMATTAYRLQQSKDCLPLDISPPPSKPHRLQSAEDTDTTTTCNAEWK
jgi:hypothetical protein